jgi:diguanylate cyclase (GGDEF)-like protein
MRGRIFVSDILISRSTGKRIVVLEVPVKDKLNYPIGMVQRNFNLDVLQEFVKTYDNDEGFIIVMDRLGKTIAHSDEKSFSFQNENDNNGRYKYIVDKVKGDSGVLRIKIDGKDVLASYSRNWITDWIVVTSQPYDQIWEQVYLGVFKSIMIGMVILLLVFVTAHVFSLRFARPIIQITNAANKIISGNGKIDKIEIDSDDEFGQMAAAFNKIRSARDAYQMESELDKLTKLYNKSTTENIGRMKIKNFNDIPNNDTFMALFIIDLDHFKEANDTYGHQFGDKVLVEFSKNLRKKFRPNDCIGRFGGDEFVVMIDNLPTMEIVIRKAKEINQVALELVVDGMNPGVTASIGIAIIPQDGTDYETVFKAADSALYYVKKHGRNGYYFKNAECVI